MDPKTLSCLDIVNALDRELLRVKVPEWGGIVFIKPMSGAHRNAFEQFITDGDDTKPNFREELLSRTLCDDQGNLLFSDNPSSLTIKSAKVIDRLYALAKPFSQAGPAAEETAKKNS